VLAGTGGIADSGAKNPFLVAAFACDECDREPSENRFLAFGAEATRRMKRLADAPTDLGESGPGRGDDDDVAGGRAKEAWDEPAVSGYAGSVGCLRARPSPFCLTVLEEDVGSWMGGRAVWEAE
jgi:hypothetical protein